jgi:hypothetical protein
MLAPHDRVEWRFGWRASAILEVTDSPILIPVTMLLVPTTLRFIHLQRREVYRDFIIFEYREIHNASGGLFVRLDLTDDKEQCCKTSNGLKVHGAALWGFCGRTSYTSRR